MLWTMCVWLAAHMTAAGATHEVTAELDQIEAAVAILEIQAEGGEPDEGMWQALWNSHGYERLIERETAMGREDGFDIKLKEWMTSSETVARARGFRQALTRWREFDPSAAAARARAYLPAGTPLRATLYPVVKHTSNSFVFDLSGDAAIFMSVDPQTSSEMIQAVMTHELHHVGLARCPDTADMERLSETQQQVVSWLGILGEGVAVLATAGGPMRHPHYYSPATEYLVWERDVADFARDLERMETFFMALLDGEIEEKDQRSRLFEFVSTDDVPQGPGYTVGWKMAAMVERGLGRDALLATMCDPRALLESYNRVVERTQTETARLPMWSAAFLKRLKPVE